MVVVKIETKTCGGCKFLAPGLEELAEKYRDQIVIISADYMVVPEPMREFQCPRIPTIVIFRNGEIVRDQFITTVKDVVEERILETLRCCGMIN